MVTSTSSGQLHYKVVEQSEGVVVREGNLSLATSSLEVRIIRMIRIWKHQRHTLEGGESYS